MLPAAQGMLSGVLERLFCTFVVNQVATSIWYLLHFVFPARRGGRVVEGGGLESRCAVPPYRGFESPPLRHYFFPSFLPYLPRESAFCAPFSCRTPLLPQDTIAVLQANCNEKVSNYCRIDIFLLYFACVTKNWGIGYYKVVPVSYLFG